MQTELMLSAAGSRNCVSPGLPLENSSGKTITAISGRKCSELLPLLNLNGCLERMSRALFQTLWASTAVSLIWRDSVTPSNRSLFRLVPLTPRTDETGCGLLHTPTGTANQMAPSMGETYPGSWWHTSHGFSKDGKSNGKNGNELGRQVNQNQWPTATATDWKRTPITSYYAMKPLTHGTPDTLGQAVCREEKTKSGSLNPHFVNWLMGYPKDWMDE